MGNICCQTQIEKNFNQDQILKQIQYKQASFPVNDPILNQWTTANKVELPNSTQNSEVKVVKHNFLDRYYYGNWKDGMPEGKAFFYEPQKFIFKGNFSHGVPTGPAKIDFISEGWDFQGQLKNGKANGNGTLHNLKQNYQYSGQWQSSRPHKGVLTFTNDQNISNIQFLDFQNKLAIINYKDGRKYEGQINTSKLQPNGKGRVLFPGSSSKISYEGEWHNGIINGKGTFLWVDGSKYDGQFIHGKKQGLGIFTFANGNYYDGYWVAGKQEGTGTIFNKNGQQIKKGHWINGNFNSQLSKQQWQNQKNASAAKRSKIFEKVESQIKLQQKVEVKHQHLQPNISKQTISVIQPLTHQNNIPVKTEIQDNNIQPAVHHYQHSHQHNHSTYQNQNQNQHQNQNQNQHQHQNQNQHQHQHQNQNQHQESVSPSKISINPPQITNKDYSAH